MKKRYAKKTELSLKTKIIPYDKARSIKREMLAHFGHTKYYRFFREELPLTPSDQSAIQKIFRQYHAGATPEYARYSEETDW